MTHLLKFRVDFLEFLFGRSLVLILIYISKVYFKITSIKVDLARSCLLKNNKKKFLIQCKEHLY